MPAESEVLVVVVRPTVGREPMSRVYANSGPPGLVGSVAARAAAIRSRTLLARCLRALEVVAEVTVVVVVMVVEVAVARALFSRSLRALEEVMAPVDVVVMVAEAEEDKVEVVVVVVMWRGDHTQSGGGGGGGGYGGGGANRCTPPHRGVVDAGGGMSVWRRLGWRGIAGGWQVGAVGNR